VLSNKNYRHLPSKFKNELLKPTKIYVKEINKLNDKKLINGCANITGGGLISNLLRVVPNKFCLNINLNEIKTKFVFKWLKKNKITDSEMLKTFNCGVGFCLITKQKNVKKIQNLFTSEYKPYQIGYISNEKEKIKISGKIKW
jgi:phosphoribosylaminoimidazole (AIR) synthetase